MLRSHPRPPQAQTDLSPFSTSKSFLRRLARRKLETLLLGPFSITEQARRLPPTPAPSPLATEPTIQATLWQPMLLPAHELVDCEKPTSRVNRVRPNQVLLERSVAQRGTSPAKTKLSCSLISL